MLDIKWGCPILQINIYIFIIDKLVKINRIIINIQKFILVFIIGYLNNKNLSWISKIQEIYLMNWLIQNFYVNLIMRFMVKYLKI